MPSTVQAQAGSYLHERIADVTVSLLSFPSGVGAHVLVSSGSDVSLKELFDATVEALGIAREQSVEVRPRSPDDAYTIRPDPSKTREDFGWCARTPLAAGVAAAIDWYWRVGPHQTYTHLKLADPKT